MSMPMLAGVGLLVLCCSSSSAATLMMGGSEETPGAGAGAGAGAAAAAGADDSGPACQPNQTFNAQTGTVPCESIDAFKPTAATFWGNYINSSVPVSSDDPTPNGGISHTFHVLESMEGEKDNEKKYIAMRKTGQHCKMVQFDITKEGNTCSYKINDAGYAGFGGGGMGAQEACTATTDAEVTAKWNAKSPVATARQAANNTGYGLKSLGYSMYC